jgi:DNA-binding transcriptional regulator YiaG
MSKSHLHKHSNPSRARKTGHSFKELVKTNAPTRIIGMKLGSVARRPQTSPVLSLGEFRSALGLPRSEFRRLLGSSERSVASWEQGSKPLPPPAQRAFQQLQRLHAELSTLLKREDIATWLLTPNATLDNFKPIEVIERGEIDRLWHLVYVLKSGTPV